VLSDLQLQVARIIAGLTEAEDFALAGGAALIVHGDVERATRDLDFFGTSPDAVDRLVPPAELALQKAGFQVDRLIDSPGFTRFVVTDQLERTEVDLASDARLFPTDAGPGFELLGSPWVRWRLSRFDLRGTGWSRLRASMNDVSAVVKP
jgi:hypothetical protein